MLSGTGTTSSFSWMPMASMFRPTSGFQAMRREVFTALSQEYPVDFPDAEVIVMLGLRKFKVAEVPVIVRNRQGGVSMYAKLGTVLYYPFKSLLASFLVLLRLVRNRKGG